MFFREFTPCYALTKRKCKYCIGNDLYAASASLFDNVASVECVEFMSTSGLRYLPDLLLKPLTSSDVFFSSLVACRGQSGTR